MATATLSRGHRILLPLLVLALSAAACGPPAGDADPERAEIVSAVAQQALLDAHGELLRAYERGDVGAIVALLSTSPPPLVFHPLVEDRFDGAEEVRAGLDRMFERLGKTTWTEAHPALVIRGDVAWITSNVLIESANLDEPFIGRGTEVWTRAGGNWRLAHAHWSADVETLKTD